MEKVRVFYYPKTVNKTVLVIDDDENRHIAIKKIYEPCGWTVFSAHCSEAAIRIIDHFYEYGERFEVIHFDHDLGKDDTTIAVAAHMEENHITCRKAIIHSMNPVGAENLRRILTNIGVKTFKIPFGR